MFDGTESIVMANAMKISLAKVPNPCQISFCPKGFKARSHEGLIDGVLAIPAITLYS